MASEVGEIPSQDFITSHEVRVLCVDDDPHMLEVAEQLLESESPAITVRTEQSASDALTTFEENEFDCLVSDYQMPKMNGIEFLQEIRERDSRIPFILFTGRGSEDVASEAISNGVTDYLQKRGGVEEYSVLAQRIHNLVSHRRVEAQFETVLESAPDALILIDRQGNIQRVNAQTEELFGYSREQLIGEQMEMLLPERFRELHIGHRETYFKNPERRPMGSDIDLYALRADGREFPVDVSISPVPNSVELGVIAAVRDITEREQQKTQLQAHQAELEQQNERLEEFASILSHDLSGPLSVAKANTNLAEKTGKKKHFDRLREVHDRMGEIIDGVLTIARTGQSPDLERIHLKTAAQGAWQTIPTDGGTLHAEEVSDTYIEADRGSLARILENLFRNAIEHSESPVDVYVESTTHGIRIRDNGPGIPEEHKSEIFESGFTLRASGNGLGLAVVKNIVTAHNWDISVSDAEEGGAVFKLTGITYLD